MKTRRKLRHVVAAAAVLGAAVIGTGVGTAEAAYSDCPTGSNCWFSGAVGGGAKWQVSGTNTSLAGYGISTQSGYNHGTSGLRVCGYRYTNYSNLNYSRAMGDTETYSARSINSNRWVSGTCS